MYCPCLWALIKVQTSCTMTGLSKRYTNFDTKLHRYLNKDPMLSLNIELLAFWLCMASVNALNMFYERLRYELAYKSFLCVFLEKLRE